MAKRTYWNTESFSKKVNELTDGEYVLLGEYTKSHDKTTFKHNKCGTVFEMSPHEFLQNHRCPNKECIIERQRKNNKRHKTYEQFAKEIDELTNGDYTVEPPYVNNKTKMTFTHKKCGTTFEMKPNAFLSGQRCPMCSRKSSTKKRTKTQEQFVQEVDDCYGKGQYTVLGTYVNADTPILVRHNVCGNEYEARPADLIRGHGCQKCAYKVRAVKIGNAHRGKHNHNKTLAGKQSSGEAIIKDVLTNHYSLQEKQDFIYGYKVSALRYKKELHFDFWIPSQRVAIEYDGVQHYKPVKHFGGEKRYEVIKYRDQLKDQYCKENNIKLIRIPYTMKDESKIIQELDKTLLAYPRQ